MKTHFRRAIPAIAAALLMSFPVAASAWLDPAQPGVVTVLDAEDSRFSAIPSEQELSWGASSSVRIKGHQDLTVLKFNLAGYRGQTVQEAELHLCRSNTDSVTSLAVSTVNVDWHEGTGTGSRTVGGPCWRWRVTPVSSSVYTTADNEWTYPRSDLTAATFGNFGSLVSYGFVANDTFRSYTSGANTFIAMKLDPAVVHAMILDQYGLSVTDARWHSGSSGPNPTIYTKDQNPTQQPRLYIKFVASADTTPPEAAANLVAQVGPENGQVVLRFDAPADPQAAKALGYNVRYSTTDNFAAATDVARWRIPRPKTPGTAQRVLIEGLTAGTTYYFFVQAYDGAGNGSEVVSTSYALPSLPSPTLIDGTFVTPDPAGKTVRTVAGIMRWWAGSEIVRLNPVTNNRVEDGYTSTTAFDNYKKANAVWNSATNTISLLACRNEVVGAQLFIERLGANLTNVGVTASNLAGPGGATIPAATHIELFQMHYVGSTPYAEPAIPLKAPFPTTFNIPDANHNATGKNQSVWMDIYVPKDAAEGNYTGTLTVTATQLASPVTVNVAVRVSRVEIPDYPTFLVDLNGYSNPWNWPASEAGKDRAVLRYFQAGHKHRIVPNALPYGHLNGIVQADRVPDSMTGSGSTLHAGSWTTLDRRYGPLFDGTAFTPTNPIEAYYGPGTNTPITHFYSTFHESWPIYILDPVLGFDALGLGPAYWYSLNPGSLTTMFTNLPDVYSAFPDGYKQGLRNVMADWVEHAQAKGWTRTAFETYHNNKYSLSWSTPQGTFYDPVFWVMEENDSADDFRADGFYHQLWRDGYAMANAPDVKWHFRIDISDRYGLNYGQLDDRINYWDLGAGAANGYWPQIKYRNYALDPDKQEDWIVYSDSPSHTASGVVFPQTFLRRWSQGFAGLLPYWNAFTTSWTAFTDPPGVIYSGQSVPGMASPYEGCLLSIRAKMMRQAEQIVELANLWAGKGGMNRALARNALFAKYGTAGSTDYSFSLDENKLYDLRADLIAQLETYPAIPADFNNDGAVDVVDLLILADAWTLSLGEAGYDPACDFNGDYTIDIVDLLTFATYWPAA